MKSDYWHEIATETLGRQVDPTPLKPEYPLYFPTLRLQVGSPPR